MNADLVGAGVYGKNEQKMVSAWLAIRNDAAHGKYNAYSHQQVSLYQAGIRDTVARSPA